MQMNAIDLRPRLLNTIGRFARNISIAEDVVDEAIFRVTANADKRNKENIFPWLYQICKNLIIDREKHLEVSKRRIRILSYGHVAPSPADVVELLEFKRSLSSALEWLTPRQKKAFELFAMDGMSEGEVSETMGIKKEAARNLMYHARRKLQIYLKRYSA
jgi:RNA polymerase sigma factor (sigma-70 family)